MQKPDTPRTVTCRCVDAAGAWHHLEAGCRNLLSDPSVRGIVLNIRDITERVESQARLTESDERFRSIVEQSWEGITIIDPDGTIAMFNAAQERMSGVPASEAVGTKIWDLQSRLMTPQARAAVPPKQRIRMYRELLTTGRSPWLNKDFDSQLVRPDGAIVDLQTVLFPISTGSRTLFVAFNRDVTELRTAETALREQNRLLQEKNVALREIMAQVEEEKARIRRNIQANVDRLVMPLVSKLKGRASMTDRPLMALLEENLADVTSGFGGAVSRRMYRLTQQEVELCDMVRRGMTSKEISRLRGVSPRTVETQRNRLRRKLGIADPGVNLTTFLMHELEPHGRAPAPAGHGKGAA